MSIATRRDTLLPDPAPRPVRYTVISVDDHLVEPPDMFEGRLPRRFAGRAPKIIENSRGHQLWEFDGGLYSQVGMNAVAGRRPECVSLEPTRFEDMRRGCWDIHARIADMDINGVWASLNFPSQITGFSGKVFSTASDPELGLAVTRAWNDWLYEAWWQPQPDRIIPCGITFLTDAESGAEEIRRNAARGFRSVTLPERPHRIG
ncbi:MAG: amidohydrolase family protein, partial [Acidimicrobiales bacterium]